MRAALIQRGFCGGLAELFADALPAGIFCNGQRIEARGFASTTEKHHSIPQQSATFGGWLHKG